MPGCDGCQQGSFVVTRFTTRFHNAVRRDNGRRRKTTRQVTRDYSDRRRTHKEGRKAEAIASLNRSRRPLAG